MYDSPEITAVRQFAELAASTLRQSVSFQELDAKTRTELLRDLGSIRRALSNESDPYAILQGRVASALSTPKQLRPSRSINRSAGQDPYALALETPNDLARRRAQLRGNLNSQQAAPSAEEKPEEDNGDSGPRPRSAATETIASRAGALSDEIDFPAFVAGLVHGTFDAMVDAAIRQMEAFAGLVSAVAKDVDRFTAENVTPNQVRDWLVEQYPRDLILDLGSGTQPTLRRRRSASDEDDNLSPAWLTDYDLEGEELTDELIEGTIVPLARRRVGENRLQTLATMVLLGMNRIIIRDGTIAAKVRFRASARDHARVDYAIAQDVGGGGGQNWGTRGGSAYSNSAMMVSTVGVNVQAESDLKAELFGEVRINFVSETLPLDRFVDVAQLTLLQRNARGSNRVPRLPGAAETTPEPTSPTDNGVS